MIYQYNNSVTIYRCPADRSTIETRDGTKLPQPRLRSYNMSQSINGIDYVGTALHYFPHYSKFTQIKDPTPGGLMVFIDVLEDEIIDDQFGIPVGDEAKDGGYWWDIPANRHNQGCNFTFADGHSEHWKWKAPKTYNGPRGSSQAVTDDEQDDFQRIESGFLQNFE